MSDPHGGSRPDGPSAGGWTQWGPPPQPPGGQPQQPPAPGPQQPPAPGQPFDPTALYAAARRSPAAASRRRRRLPILAAAVAGALVLGGGGAAYAAYSWWSAPSGADPATVLPAGTIAYAAVNLDPAGSQKVSLARFAMKFPRAKAKVGNLDENTDLKKAVFEAIRKEGGLTGVDYDADVEPWLGDRFAVAAVKVTDGAPTPVVVLPVTDPAKARVGLARVTATQGGACEVGEQFAICAQEQAKAHAVLAGAKAATLAASPSFVADMNAVGTDAIISVWADGTAIDPSMLPGLPGTTMTGSSGTPRFSGRLAAAVRFTDANLELRGHVSGGPATWVGTESRTPSIARLPADTTAAVGLSGLGTQLKANWGELTKAMASAGSEVPSPIAQVEQELGVRLPDDLVAALGNDLVAAYGGTASGGTPNIAVRTDGSKEPVQRLLRRMDGASGAVVIKEAGGHTTYGSSDAYAAKVAGGTGLGDTAAFKDALPDLEGSQLAGYVNIDGVVRALGTSGMSEDDRRSLGALSALGVTARAQGSSVDYHLVLTTK